MKKNIFILVIALSFSAWGQVTTPQPLNQLKFSSYEHVKKSADTMRAHKDEIREFFIEMMARKAYMDVNATLKAKHFVDSDVQKVLESEAMKSFLNRIRENPLVQAKVDKYVNKLLQPGYIETYVMKQRQQLTKQIEGDVLIARNEIRKSENFREREEVFTDRDERSLARKLWDHLVDDLYRN